MLPQAGQVFKKRMNEEDRKILSVCMNGYDCRFWKKNDDMWFHRCISGSIVGARECHPGLHKKILK